MLSKFTSESVAEGHPDKVCDLISDSILDAHLAEDPHSHIACETLCKSNKVVIAGEITSKYQADPEQIARRVIREIGYTNPDEHFNANGVEVHLFLTGQAGEIRDKVDPSANREGEQGAGDQGMLFGFACTETPELMPLPIMLAHKLTRGLAEDRRSGKCSWLGPDAKSQVSVLYDGHEPKQVTDVLISTQHSKEASLEEIRAYVIKALAPRILKNWFHEEINIMVNPYGTFIQGGPSADCGLTGRKIIVDTYGGASRHGGGAFSGKDPSKVDRSGAYFCRWVARQIVKKGFAKRAEVQVAYIIGQARPVSVKVETFGTGDERRAANFVNSLDFRPSAIIERFDLLRPIYRLTTNYGHFGKPDLPWEE